MDPLCTRLDEIRGQIRAAEATAGRCAGSVSLLAVSKGQTAHAMRAAFVCGQRNFGESYLQEALPKIEALKDLSIVWHFIGPVQANKTRAIAECFSWVHGVDRLRIAERLSAQRPPHAPALNVCLQVNISGESSKSGVTAGEVAALAAQVAELKLLRFRGLMAIGAPHLSYEAQRRSFAELRLALDDLNARGFLCDTLSMGMSEDFSAAIAEGATLVRIGQAVFGPRI